jgi:hypothetical protein
MEPQSDLAVLYNTVQGVVALRALGQHPRIDPVNVVDRFFIDNAFEKLPWYPTPTPSVGAMPCNRAGATQSPAQCVDGQPWMGHYDHAGASLTPWGLRVEANVLCMLANLKPGRSFRHLLAED